MNPYRVVAEFEETIAAWAGAKYGVAVESCTAALFLSLKYATKDLEPGWFVSIPKNTYPGVACSIIHAGGLLEFSGVWHESVYRLRHFLIWDSALRFRPRMFVGGFHCLSFHARKQLPIGRGGMILTDNAEAVRWFKLARFDGRQECALSLQNDFNVLGWNMYMTPEQASRGLVLFQAMGGRDLPDLDVAAQGYPDLSQFPIFRKGAA